MSCCSEKLGRFRCRDYLGVRRASGTEKYVVGLQLFSTQTMEDSTNEQSYRTILESRCQEETAALVPNHEAAILKRDQSRHPSQSNNPLRLRHDRALSLPPGTSTPQNSGASWHSPEPRSSVLLSRSQKRRVAGHKLDVEHRPHWIWLALSLGTQIRRQERHPRLRYLPYASSGTRFAFCLPNFEHLQVYCG